ncbi:hypothetical protein DL93DRAFT_1087138 [Clavulina sp. PMI_390]|nr:hypothetical protein DL93DRAFT_1087138 [Clavulina sp. PMI_390]
MGKGNRSSTILHIPVELLSEILLILVETYPIVDRNSVLPLLGSVCRQWRETALSLPRLWAFIVFRGTRSQPSPGPKAKHRMRLLLERSRSAPLDIIYHLDSAVNSASHMASFQKLIVPHLSCCRTLHISLNSMEQLQSIMPLPKSLDMLRWFNLDIRTKNPPNSPTPPTLLFEPGNNARLQHLRIVSTWTPFSTDNISSQALQNLTYSPPSATPYTDTVIEWLEKAPALKECIVTASTVPLGKPADLPDLRFLRITTVDPFKIFCAANLVRLDWTIPPLGISTDTDLVQAGRELPNLRHLSISSLALGELALILPFIREVTELVHLRVYKWVWTDVLGIIEALTIRGSRIPSKYMYIEPLLTNYPPSRT